MARHGGRRWIVPHGSRSRFARRSRVMTPSVSADRRRARVTRSARLTAVTQDRQSTDTPAASEIGEPEAWSSCAPPVRPTARCNVLGAKGSGVRPSPADRPSRLRDEAALQLRCFRSSHARSRRADAIRAGIALDDRARRAIQTHDFRPRYERDPPRDVVDVVVLSGRCACSRPRRFMVAPSASTC